MGAVCWQIKINAANLSETHDSRTWGDNVASFIPDTKFNAYGAGRIIFADDFTSRCQSFTQVGRAPVGVFKTDKITVLANPV
jgi:hypothetical protein